MTNWDQDIHRIQEIQKLLEDRQRFFRGHLNTSFYKVDNDGNPKYFPNLPHPGSDINTVVLGSPTEPSIGQSLEANAGSLISDAKDRIFNAFEANVESTNGKNEADYQMDDALSDGHCADHSQTDTTDSSGDEKESSPKKAKRKSLKARRLRKLGESNNIIISQGTIKMEKPPIPRNPPTTAISRQKSVSFEEHTTGETISTEEDNPVEKSTSADKDHQKQRPDALSLLKRRSWLLRNEVARRLNESDLEVDHKDVLHKVTISTLAHAREKLRNAEKSYLTTVKDEKKKSIMGRVVPADDQFSFEKILIKPTPTTQAARKMVSRLAVRHAEEAFKSDLNLREAFALIKIDPEPLLDLAPLEKEKRSEDAMNKSVRLSRSDFSAESRRPSRQRMDSTIFDDPETLRSLGRLTRLSSEHKQKQKSLVPERMNILQPNLLNKKSVKNESGRSDGARKSSTVGPNSIKTGGKSKRSKELRRSSGPNLAFSKLEASLRAERKGFGPMEKQHHHHLIGYRMEKLAGTVL